MALRAKRLHTKGLNGRPREIIVFFNLKLLITNNDGEILHIIIVEMGVCTLQGLFEFEN